MKLHHANLLIQLINLYEKQAVSKEKPASELALEALKFALECCNKIFQSLRKEDARLVTVMQRLQDACSSAAENTPSEITQKEPSENGTAEITPEIPKKETSKNRAPEKTSKLLSHFWPSLASSTKTGVNTITPSSGSSDSPSPASSAKSKSLTR